MFDSLINLKLALENRQISVVEIVEHYLHRIQQLDSSINAMITLNDSVIDTARSYDQLLSQNKDKLPPLFGLPIIHKDIFCTQDNRTTCGSKMLETFKPGYDATVVSRLRAAGMLSLGKSNMDEFAMGSSNENSYFGPCKNPWDTTRVCGGSSGGSAAAVAAGFCPVATGSDTGGSIRQPASYCGITGLKPTYGTLSRYGMIAFASSLDQAGFFARDVRDIALLLEQTVGQDPNDSTTLPVTKKSYLDICESEHEGLTIGIPDFVYQCQIPQSIASSFEKTIQELSQMGHKVKTISLDHIKHSLAVYYIIAPAECSSNLARFDGIKYGYRSSSTKNLERLYKQTRSEAFGDEVKRRIFIGTFTLSSGYYDAYYDKAAKVRTLIKQDFTEAFKDVDLILTPTAPSTAFKIGEKTENPVDMYMSDLFTLPSSLAGMPSISFPSGLDELGLPIGSQLIANAHQEDILLKTVRQYQKTTNWHESKSAILMEEIS